MSLVYAIADPHSDDGRVLRAVRETLSAAAQARRAEPLAIAIPRAPDCPIKVLTLPVKVQNGR